ncbi:MAG: stage II sporulation protein M [Anaerolineales bacterium]|nr:stage II sporulation protein M [Anaerolineales bacterium]
MSDTLRPIWIIMRREIRDQFRDWRIILPILVLTLFFPGLMNFTAEQVVNYIQSFDAPLIGDRLIPFLLMVVGFFPISVSLVIALESFVGEKERRSIEPLLSSPLTDFQLYLGKLLAVLVPPLLASYLGILVYLIGVNRQVGWSPDPLLLIQVLILSSVQALLMVSGAVVISSQTTSTRAANLLASFIIVPMALLLIGESMVMFWARYDVLWWAIGGQLLIAGLLVRTGIAHFNREELLGRELDTLNLKWSWQVFIRAFKGQAGSLGQWYRREMRLTLGRLAIPLLLACFVLLAGGLLGLNQAGRFTLPQEFINLDNLQSGFAEGVEMIDTIRFFSIDGIGLVWFHNLRSIVLATLLGLFSFGVLGLLVLMLPFLLIGFFTGTIANLGVPPGLFLTAFVLPHGVFEIPAIILAGAAILRLGATLSAPAPGRSISEALLEALADWTRTMLALVAPMLLLAAMLEVYVTPRVALLLLGN